MVANRKKLRKQVAAGDSAAEERQGKERKKKLKKRKLKKMEKKEMESEKLAELQRQLDAEKALALEERKEAKLLKREERKKRRQEENVGGEGQATEVRTKKRKHEENGVQEEPMVLSIKGEDGEAKQVDEAEDNGTLQKKKKSRKNAKKLDRWGAPVVEDQAPAADVADEGGEEKSEQGEEYDPRKVYVGGMPYTTSEDDIFNYFAECGAIEEMNYTNFPDTGRFRGLVFITFKTETGAKKALELDGADMNGRFLRIMKCKTKQEQRKPVFAEPTAKTEGYTTAYIGNLSWHITEEDLKKFFKKCKIQGIRLAKDRDTGKFKGYGHIDFEDDDSLERAVKMDQKLLLDRPMKISYAVPPKKSSTAEAENGRSEARKKNGCFTCGEEGHKSFHCPMKA